MLCVSFLFCFRLYLRGLSVFHSLFSIVMSNIYISNKEPLRVFEIRTSVLVIKSLHWVCGWIVRGWDHVVRNDLADKRPARLFLLVAGGGVGFTFIENVGSRAWRGPFKRPRSGKLTDWPPTVLLQRPTLQGLETDANKYHDPDETQLLNGTTTWALFILLKWGPIMFD